MQRIDSGSQVPTLPTPPGEISPGFFKDGQLGVGSGTVVDAAFMNSIQEEICSVIEDAGVTLDRIEYDQLNLAVGLKIAAATPDATDSVKGLVELATLAEMRAGIDDARAITPASLGNADEDNRGVVELATDAEAAAGLAGDRAITPANLAQNFSATFPIGRLELVGTGLLFQWVSGSFSGGQYLTFGAAFADTNYVIMTAIGTAWDTAHTVTFTIMSATQVRLNYAGGGALQIWLGAIGKK